MKKKINEIPNQNELKKYEVIVDFGEIVSIWRYDPKFSKTNPYEMEQIYKGDSK